MPQEGDTARGPNGEAAVFRNGRWVVQGQQSQGSAPPPDPTYQYEGPQAAENLENTREGREDRRFRQVRDLRGEFIALPAVKEYNVALGTLNAARGAAQTAQGDQSLIVAYARMLDPNSVVREQEFTVTAGNESTFNQLQARIRREFGMEGGGRLTPDGRREILGEMRNIVVSRFEPAYRNSYLQYSSYAQRNGFDAYDVVGDRLESSFPPNLLDPVEAPEASNDLADPGATTQASGEIPSEMQQRIYDYHQKNWGNLDPQAYTAFRTALDREFNFEPDAAGYQQFANAANQFAEAGGLPSQLGPIQPPESVLGDVQSSINDFAQSGTGAFLTSAANAGGFGLPGVLAGQDKMEALREERPTETFFGEMAGSASGGALGGAMLGNVARAMVPGRAANLLANPITAEAGYGATYGATQDTANPFRGAIYGALGGAGGAMAGQQIGRALPGLFANSAVRQADASVPSIDDLKTQASQQYQAAEAAGQTASPEDTLALQSQINGTLSQEGRLTPQGNLIDIDSPTARAYRLISDFAGEEMTPTQAGSVRGVLGEGRMAQDRAQQRIAGSLTEQFDEWADPVLPGVADARDTASRYLQGEEIAQARRLAEADTSRLTQSGQENAIRGQFRNIERQSIRGTRIFPEHVDSAIQRVAEGTGFSNAMRGLGRLAPTSPMAGIMGPGAIGALVGGATGPATGAMAMAGTAGLGLAARAVATQQARRSAEVAELMARGGLPYQEALDEATRLASRRAGGLFGGISAGATSSATR